MSDPHQSPPNTGQQQWPSGQTRQSPAPAYPGTAAGPVPLWAPLYGASLPEAVSRFFKKYATFTGRASRSEYWWWVLISVIVSVVVNVLMLAGTIGAKLGPNGTSVPGPAYAVGLILAVIWCLAVAVPSLALTVRRLHDANFSGWMILLGFVPLAGPFIILAFTLTDSKPEGQRFDAPGLQANTWQQ